MTSRKYSLHFQSVLWEVVKYQKICRKRVVEIFPDVMVLLLITIVVTIRKYKKDQQDKPYD